MTYDEDITLPPMNIDCVSPDRDWFSFARVPNKHPEDDGKWALHASFCWPTRILFAVAVNRSGDILIGCLTKTGERWRFLH